MMKSINVASSTYHDGLKQLSDDKRKSITSKVNANEYYLVFDDIGEVLGGYATLQLPHNHLLILGLFSLQKGIGSKILKMIQEDNKDQILRLFCTNRKLLEYYELQGFTLMYSQIGKEYYELIKGYKHEPLD